MSYPIIDIESETSTKAIDLKFSVDLDLYLELLFV